MDHDPQDEPRQRFERVYEAHYPAITRYALRRTSSADDAVDVVAFLTAWRRLDDVPDGDEARLWLYAIARRPLPTSIVARPGGSGWPNA